MTSYRPPPLLVVQRHQNTVRATPLEVPLAFPVASELPRPTATHQPKYGKVQGTRPGASAARYAFRLSSPGASKLCSDLGDFSEQHSVVPLPAQNSQKNKSFLQRRLAKLGGEETGVRTASKVKIVVTRFYPAKSWRLRRIATA